MPNNKIEFLTKLRDLMEEHDAYFETGDDPCATP